VAVSFIGGGNQSTRRKPPRGGQFYWWRKPEYPEKTTDFGLVYSVSRNFQQYFSYMMAVSFIGGGNRSTQRKPLIYRKLLTNFIT